MARLLAACEVLPEPAAGIMRAYIALAGFAGIRPEELHRLDWADVSLAESSAFTRADVSKVGEARQVPLSQNCTAWLETVSVRSGAIAPKAGFRYRFDAVWAAAGYSVRGNEGSETRVVSGPLTCVSEHSKCTTNVRNRLGSKCTTLRARLFPD